MAERKRIGVVARELGINPKTIRYYEEIGLISEPVRTPQGYRLYDRDAVERHRLHSARPRSGVFAR